jgi:hypothetical protein
MQQIRPVVIVAHPDTEARALCALAAYAVSHQWAPLVLHAASMPWLPPASHGAPPQATALMDTLARHTGARLWLLLRPGEGRGGGWPLWVVPWVRQWQRSAGRMPSRIRSGDPEVWAQALAVLA